MPEEYDNPIELRNAELCDLNKVLGSIGKLISKRYETRKIEEFDSSEREMWERGEELVEYFLWKICLQETDNVAVAAAAVTETRCDLFDKLRKNKPPKGLEWFIEQCGSMLVPFNVWLFLRARQHLRESDLALKAGMLSPGKHSPLPPKSIFFRDLEWLMKLPDKCRLGNYQIRRKKDDHDGKRAAIRQILSANNCPRVCDVLMLASLGFTLREIATALGINKDLAFSSVFACETRFGSMKQASAVTASRPGFNRPSPEKIV